MLIGEKVCGWTIVDKVRIKKNIQIKLLCECGDVKNIFTQNINRDKNKLLEHNCKKKDVSNNFKVCIKQEQKDVSEKMNDVSSCFCDDLFIIIILLNSILKTEKQEASKEVKEVIDFYNKELNVKIRSDNLNYISGRLKEGYTVDEIKLVIKFFAARNRLDSNHNYYWKSEWLAMVTILKPSKFYINLESAKKMLKEGD